MNKIILASKSPRRKELLEKMGVDFTIIPSNFNEDDNVDLNIETKVKKLAIGKALDIATAYPEDYIIGSDTLVAINNKILGKPTDINEARITLELLAGKDSIVSTGIAVINIKEGIEIVDVATTHVYFKNDCDEISQQREKYLKTGDWKDKAGSYGIQSGAMPLIDHIVGDYDTVVGLPTKKLQIIFDVIGITTKL